MKLIIRLNTILSLVTVSNMAVAFDVVDVNVAGQAEAFWQYTPVRGDTVFNPNSLIVKNQEHVGTFGLRLSPQYQLESITLRGDYWGQYQLAKHNEQSDFYVQTSVMDWHITDNLALSGGIDLLKWGSGYIWNPSNPFQDRNLNFVDRGNSYKRKGDTYVSLDWIGEKGIEASSYYVSYKSREQIYGDDVPYENAFAFKLRKQFTSSDVTFNYASLDGMNFLGGSYSATVTDKLELHGEFSFRDRRQTVLPTFVTINGTSGFYTFQRDRDIQWLAQFLVGGQYTTDEQTNYIVEYYYNGEGYSNNEFKHLESAGNFSTMQLQGGTYAGPSAGFLGNSNALLGSMKRHYLFGRVANEHMIGNIEANMYVRYGIQDSGVILGGLLRYPLGQATKVMLGGSLYGKVSHSETNSIPDDFVLYTGFSLVF